MHLNNNNHLVLHKSLNDPMSKLYFYQAMLTFVKSLIGIFVPVYLYKLGYSFIEILLYTMGVGIMYLILIPISIKTINKIGFKYTLLLTTPIYLFHITTLNFLDSGILFYHLSWISFGIYVSFFWPAMHSEIAVSGSKKHRGSQLGTLQIISTIVATLAPLIGGIFLDQSGYFYLLILASIILFIGFIPLFFSKDIKLENYKFSYSDYFRLIKNKKTKNSKLAFISEGIELSIVGIHVWPILVFILLSQSFIKFGMLISAVSVLSVFFILYFRKFIDGKDRNKILNIITKVMSFNYLLKSLVLFFGSFFLYFVESIGKLVQNSFSISYYSIFYNNASKMNYMDYIILRELYLHIAKIIGSIIIIIFALFFEVNVQFLSIVLIFGILFAFGLNYMIEDKS